VLGDADLVAFAASRNLEVSGRFYGDVLGFRLLEANEFANAYDANGTQLRVTLVDRIAEAPYTVLGWRVLDIVVRSGRFVRRAWCLCALSA
jgi:catechol 2,3-dioxygenase-like lactoylglutathione lyase family enzyme